MICWLNAKPCSDTQRCIEMLSANRLRNSRNLPFSTKSNSRSMLTHSRVCVSLGLTRMLCGYMHGRHPSHVTNELLQAGLPADVVNMAVATSQQNTPRT